MRLENNLRVFLSYASNDYKKVVKRYRQLIEYGFDAWLDKVDIVPGHNWDYEIRNAIDNADVIIIFLSNNSVSKEGYIQKEVLMALDKASEKPEDTLFLIPVRLEDCQPPYQLKKYQYVDLYKKNGFAKLVTSLNVRAVSLKKNTGHLLRETFEIKSSTTSVTSSNPYKNIKESVSHLSSNELAILYSMLMPGQEIPSWTQKLLRGIFYSIENEKDALKTIEEVATEFNMYEVLKSLSHTIRYPTQRRYS